MNDNKKSFFILLCLLCAVALLLRGALLHLGWPGGRELEALAQIVQGREVRAEEAVLAFCQR